MGAGVPYRPGRGFGKDGNRLPRKVFRTGQAECDDDFFLETETGRRGGNLRPAEILLYQHGQRRILRPSRASLYQSRSRIAGRGEGTIQAASKGYAFTVRGRRY